MSMSEKCVRLDAQRVKTHTASCKTRWARIARLFLALRVKTPMARFISQCASWRGERQDALIYRSWTIDFLALSVNSQKIEHVQSCATYRARFKSLFLSSVGLWGGGCVVWVGGDRKLRRNSILREKTLCFGGVAYFVAHNFNVFHQIRGYELINYIHAVLWRHDY